MIPQPFYQSPLVPEGSNDDEIYVVVQRAYDEHMFMVCVMTDNQKFLGKFKVSPTQLDSFCSSLMGNLSGGEE